MYELTLGWGSSKEVMLIKDTRSLVQIADDLKTKGYIITTSAECSDDAPEATQKMAVMFTQVSHIRLTDE